MSCQLPRLAAGRPTLALTSTSAQPSTRSLTVTGSLPRLCAALSPSALSSLSLLSRSVAIQTSVLGG